MPAVFSVRGGGSWPRHRNPAERTHKDGVVNDASLLCQARRHGAAAAGLARCVELR